MLDYCRWCGVYHNENVETGRKVYHRAPLSSGAIQGIQRCGAQSRKFFARRFLHCWYYQVLVSGVKFNPLTVSNFMSPKTYVYTAYIALVNDPPVHNFVSICGPLEGEATCPANIAFDLICPIWKLDPYGADLAFSGYWKNTKDKETYVRLCRIAKLGLPVPLTSAYLLNFDYSMDCSSRNRPCWLMFSMKRPKKIQQLLKISKISML